MDWAETVRTLFGERGDISWWQMSLRAVLIFAFGLALVRLAHKRIFGKWGAMDIVVSVIIGSNLSRAITGTAPLFETMTATAVLVAIHSLLSDAAARWNVLGPILKGRSARLITDGVVDLREMRRHAIGERDLAEALRKDGVDDVSKVRAAWLERNGEISVLTR